MLLVTRPVGHGGVANYYDALRPYLPSDVVYCEINNPDAKNILSKLFSFPLILLRYVKLLRNTSVVCLNPSLDAKAYYRDMIFLVLARIQGRKTIVFFRGWLEEYECEIKASIIKLKIFQYTYGKNEAFVVLGNIFERKLIGMGVNQSATFYKLTTVASHGISSGHEPFSKALVKHKVHCLFMSRLVPGKGIDEAIVIYLLLKEKLLHLDVDLTIAGEGSEENRIKMMVNSKKLEGISFVGHVSGNEKDELLNKMHLLIFPSYSEGLPNVILEAMLYGLVLASTPVGGIPDVVKDGKNGILISLNDLSEDVARLVSIFNNQNKVYEIARLNQQLAMDNFLPEKVASKFMHILKEVDSNK